MKKNIVLVLLIFFAVGCAAGRTQIIEPKKASFKNYPVLEVTDFKNNAGSVTPTEMMQRLPDAIAEKLSSLNLFQAVNRIPAMAQDASDKKTLVLKGNIIEYNPGSRGKRYLAGFTGWGKAFVTVQLIAIDKVANAEIFKGNIGSELSGGFFGGGFDEVIDKLVEETVKCVQMNY